MVNTSFYDTELVYQRATNEVERVVRRRAVRAVCRLADDATVAATLLDILGLDPEEGRDAVASDDSPPTEIETAES